MSQHSSEVTAELEKHNQSFSEFCYLHKTNQNSREVARLSLGKPSAAAIATVLKVAIETDEQVLSLLGTAALNYVLTNFSQFSP